MTTGVHLEGWHGNGIHAVDVEHAVAVDLFRGAGERRARPLGAGGRIGCISRKGGQKSERQETEQTGEIQGRLLSGDFSAQNLKLKNFAPMLPPK